MAVRDWFQGLGDGTRAIKLGEVWRGVSPSISGIDLKPGESREELWQIGVTFDAMEAAFDVQERGGGPARNLIGLEPPA